MPCFFCKIGSCIRVNCEGKKKKIQIATKQEKMNLMVVEKEKPSCPPPLAPQPSDDDEEVSSEVAELECESEISVEDEKVSDGSKEKSPRKEVSTSVVVTGNKTLCSPGEREKVADNDGSYTSPPPPPQPQSQPSLGYKKRRSGAMVNMEGEAIGNPNQQGEAIRNPTAPSLLSKCANMPPPALPLPPQPLLRPSSQLPSSKPPVPPSLGFEKGKEIAILSMTNPNQSVRKLETMGAVLE